MPPADAPNTLSAHATRLPKPEAAAAVAPTTPPKLSVFRQAMAMASKMDFLSDRPPMACELLLKGVQQMRSSALFYCAPKGQAPLFCN